MAVNQSDAASVSNPASSTAYTPSQTSSGTATDLGQQDDIQPSFSSIPEAGSSFLKQSVLTGKVITHLQGKIVLAPLGRYNMTRLQCVENKGWLGF